MFPTTKGYKWNLAYLLVSFCVGLHLLHVISLFDCLIFLTLRPKLNSSALIRNLNVIWFYMYMCMLMWTCAVSMYNRLFLWQVYCWEVVEITLFVSGRRWYSKSTTFTSSSIFSMMCWKNSNRYQAKQTDRHVYIRVVFFFILKESFLKEGKHNMYNYLKLYPL